MTHSTSKRVLFLFSDTGGGHRSATQAIIEALHLHFPHAFSIEMIDFLKDYAPPPINLSPKLYAWIAKVPFLWKFVFQLSNGRKRTHLFYRMVKPYIYKSVMKLLREHPCDLIVIVHPVAVNAFGGELNPQFPPYITVVTDMVSGHTWWYNSNSSLVFVPTELARQNGLSYGLHPDCIQVVGVPIEQKFCQAPPEISSLRNQFGWSQNLPIILLIGGGEGMGKLFQTARAISKARLQATLVIISGRNKKLKARLEAQTWEIPTFIYGFVNQIPDFMHCADILVTKAGPSTISEAFIAGLPIILYDKMPGQEEGNIAYVTHEGAGVWAPTSSLILATIQNWLDHPEQRLRFATNSQKLAKPNAAQQIAFAIAQQLSTPTC